MFGVPGAVSSGTKRPSSALARKVANSRPVRKTTSATPEQPVPSSGFVDKLTLWKKRRTELLSGATEGISPPTNITQTDEKRSSSTQSEIFRVPSRGSIQTASVEKERIDSLERKLDALTRNVHAALKQVSDSTFRVLGVCIDNLPVLEAPSTDADVIEVVPAGTSMTLMYPMVVSDESHTFMKFHSVNNAAQISVGWVPVDSGIQFQAL